MIKKQKPILMGIKKPIKGSKSLVFGNGGVITVYVNEVGKFSITFRPQNYSNIECFLFFGDKLIPTN